MGEKISRVLGIKTCYPEHTSTCMASELQYFVKESLERGQSRKSVKDVLRKAGWPLDEISTALDTYAEVDFPVPVPRRKPYLSAREAFMYLVMFLTLYISAISFGTLLFQFINKWYPDPLLYLTPNISAIREAASSLIIAYPVFLFVALRLERAIRKDPEKRTSKIRKWLTYVTLFIAAGVIIGDLITLVSNLLRGDLTTPFVLKVLVVGAIAGTIFGYYLLDLRTEEKPV